ncbi:GatB/YqeY domain-containing protein [Filibacter tadaridae]|uniref:Glutamyl-tRNA(Gln) amidotransferase subunit E n=1 Tax=Filibacter tadaridae TaxID=2483811 RepID=A0A3P5WUF8_9BACL|nr:GatB/YqeY domain-containing protein [Filibacter tadaridae]VDC24992.1 glutamyl-tRNA(Gln) amidotransferase subunit E [Filibacter tadaridae]
MTLKQQLKDSMKEAMKAKNKEELTSVRLVLSTIQKKEIDKNDGEELTDAEVMQIIQTEIKQTQESLGFAIQTNKTEMISDLENRKQFLTKYLPEQLSEDEVKIIIAGIIESNGFSGKQDMGKVMGLAMAELKGKTEGSLISKVVKELL